MRGCTEPSLLFFFPKSFDTDVKSSKDAFLVYAFFLLRGNWTGKSGVSGGERVRFSRTSPYQYIQHVGCMYSVLAMYIVCIHTYMYVECTCILRLQPKHGSMALWLHGYMAQNIHFHPADHSHGPICIPSRPLWNTPKLCRSLADPWYVSSFVTCI